jgi:hypothetical protein
MTLLLPDAPELITDLEDVSYSDEDMSALKRAIQIVQSDPSRAEQINSLLRDHSWSEVAEFAAACCQRHALQLKPWECPPAFCADEASERFLDRMIAAGISQWEPDPIKALKKKKAW